MDTISPPGRPLARSLLRCGLTRRQRASLAGALALMLGGSGAITPASADVTFSVEFEAGSLWYTESWSESARDGMIAFLTDVGKLFDSNAQAQILVTDDEHVGAGSAGPSWFESTSVPDRDGLFSAPALWWIIVKGVDKNGAGADAKLNWNLDANYVAGGNVNAMIANIRGLGRHEMHHALGSLSSIGHSTTYDPRGSEVYPSLLDNLYRDLNDQRVLGDYHPATKRFTVNNYALHSDWSTAANHSGLYAEARDIRGQIVKMPPFSGSQAYPPNTRIDCSHLFGISYTGDHPDWPNYVAEDFNFLRALGYPLKVDAALGGRAHVVDFAVTGNDLQVTCQTTNGGAYRIKSSADLERWRVDPRGVIGSGSPMVLTLPGVTDPRQFIQVVEIPD